MLNSSVGAFQSSFGHPIIDAHCHYGAGDGFTGPWDTRAPLKRYLMRAEHVGITHVALIPALARNYQLGNRQVAELVSNYPERFMGFVSIDPLDNPHTIEMTITSYVGNRGFVGIKIHHYNGRITRAVCEAALSHHVPILWDNGDDPYAIELAASEYPDIDFIIPHLGSFSDNWRAQRACIDIMHRQPNVYADSSGVRRFDLLEEACLGTGALKLLFGSDGPWLNPAVEIEKIYALGLSAEHLQMVLGGNFLGLLQKRGRAILNH